VPEPKVPINLRLGIISFFELLPIIYLIYLLRNLLAGYHIALFWEIVVFSQATHRKSTPI